MDEGMMQGGAPRSMRSPGFAARGFLRHEAEFPGSQTSLAADAPAITFQRSKSISNLEVFDTREYVGNDTIGSVIAAGIAFYGRGACVEFRALKGYEAKNGNPSFRHETP